jgi:hypothetical protein
MSKNDPWWAEALDVEYYEDTLTCPFFISRGEAQNVLRHTG